MKLKTMRKRCLALTLALAVILSSVASTLLFQVMAEDSAVGVEHFEVTYGSPDLLVQFERDGEFVSGRDITWSAAEEGSTADTFKITKNVTVELPEPEIEVKPTNTPFSYVVDVKASASTKTLIPNSLIARDNGKDIKVLTTYGTSGKSFSFTALSSDVSISAKYLEDEDMAAKYGSSIEDDVFFLGREIRIATGTQSAGIKFINRLPAIKYDGSSITSGSITLDDGSTATVKAIGTLVIPSILLGDANLAIPEDIDFDADSTTVKLGDSVGQEAMNIKHQVVTSYTEDFSDVKAILGGLDELGLTEAQYKALKISAVTYIQYETADGTIAYAYGDVQESSYNDVWNAMYPTYDTHSDYFEVYTKKEIYEDDEDISVTIRVAGNCNIKYFVYKDGTAQELISGVTNGPIVTLTLPASLTDEGANYKLELFACDHYNENTLPTDKTTPFVKLVSIKDSPNYEIEDDDDGFEPGYW